MVGQYNELLTVEDSTEILRIKKKTPYFLWSFWKLKTFKINRVWKIPRQSVDKYVLGILSL